MSWQVAKLKQHPSYAELGLTVSSSRLNALVELGDDPFLFPLMVTSSGIVIDGYARLELARLQGRAIVECVEYEISDEEWPSAAFCFVIDRLMVCLPSAASLWLGVSQNPSEKSHFNASKCHVINRSFLTPPILMTPFACHLVSEADDFRTREIWSGVNECNGDVTPTTRFRLGLRVL